MAVTAAIWISPSVCNGSAVSCTAVLTNSVSGTAVAVTRITPYVTDSSGTASFAADNVVKPIGISNLLGASTTATTQLFFPFGVEVFVQAAPLNPPYPSSPAYVTYTIDFNAEMSDGTVVNASGTVYVYPLTQDSTLALTQMPVPGQLFFAQNTESALAGAIWMP